MEVGPDGLLYVVPSTSIGGQAMRGGLVGLSPTSVRPVPWRPAHDGFILLDRLSFTPDCFVPPADSTVKCHPRALPSPSQPTVTQAGNGVTLSWNLPNVPPVWTGAGVEGGRE